MSGGVGGDAFDRVFGGISKTTGEQAGAINKASEAFGMKAGPSRSFDSSGAQGALRGALDPQSGQAALQAAQQYVNAEYAGPKNLEEAIEGDDIDQVQKNVQGLQQRQGALGSSYGIEALLQDVIPELNPGELRFEATRARSDPEFQKRSLAAQGDIARVVASLGQREKEAGGIYSKRAAEEQDIRDRSRSFLTGEQGSILDALRGRTTAEQEAYDKQYEALDRFAQSGALEDLRALDPEVLGGVDPNRFDTEGRRLYEEGTKERERILADYADLKEIPYLDPGISSHGRQRWEFPTEWFEKNKGKYSKQDLEALRTRATARQEALAAAGFDPIDLAGTGPGKYSSILPSTLEEAVGLEFAPQDIRAYATSVDAGLRPTMEGIASDDERGRVNRINEILNLKDADLQDPVEKPRRVKLALDAAAYVEDQLAELEGRKEALSKAEQDYRRNLRKARKHYKGRNTPLMKASREIFGDNRFAAVVGGGAEALKHGDLKGAMSTGAKLMNPALWAELGYSQPKNRTDQTKNRTS